MKDAQSSIPLGIGSHSSPTLEYESRNRPSSYPIVRFHKLRVRQVRGFPSSFPLP